MKKHESIGIGIPEILLPRADIDLTKWAVVACDQYTSEPEYWEQVRKTVGSAPSTLKLIYPEVFLNDQDPQVRIDRIQAAMSTYLDKDVLESAEGMVYVERRAGGKIRRGLVVCVDLEQYDYTRGSSSLIRATEGTIVERIPPRVKIRKGAPLELPHIMVLIDDPDNSVFGPLASNSGRLEKVYDFDLMMNSGHLTGYRVNDADLEDGVIKALEGLADPKAFAAKYDLPDGTPVLLYAMGDGNHSLATAKAIWEETKKDAADKTAVMGSPLRYALVELVNLHDESLVFEPIHRVVFDLAEGRDLLREMAEYYGADYVWRDSESINAMIEEVVGQRGETQLIGVIEAKRCGVIEISNPPSNLPVGSLQQFLDGFMKGGGAREIDYVHGSETVTNLGMKSGNIGFFLPAMDKNDLFKTVILDGALPRKTFSMGEAEEKRFYMECRRLG